jgi:hypothetical protein
MNSCPISQFAGRSRRHPKRPEQIGELVWIVGIEDQTASSRGYEFGQGASVRHDNRLAKRHGFDSNETEPFPANAWHAHNVCRRHHRVDVSAKPQEMDSVLKTQSLRLLK